MSLDTIIGPTPERLARDQFEKPHKDQQTDRPAWRALSVPEQMGLAHELCDAYLDFVNDLKRAERTASGVGDYGERIASSSDPHESMARIVADRIKAGSKARSAFHVITDRKTAEVLCKLVDGYTPERIGREVLNKNNRPQAVAAAHERIEMACTALAIGYGYIRPGWS
jgi:hypothetical protein